MAKKETYRHKHAASIDDSTKSSIAYVDITPEQKAFFEGGQVLLIDKPLHWTSFDVVRKIRGSIKIKKVGHAGTLDPLATGLLIVCTGKYTKKINEYMAQPKEYTGSFTLGMITPTYDLESTPEQVKPIEHITAAEINAAAATFIGPIMQTPPIYSAIKKDGVALYELARRGAEVELKPRPITIYAFEITNIELPLLSFKVACSTGTYIRSLAHDLGQVLGCGAYLSSLRRTKIGDFDVASGLTVNAFLQQLAIEAKTDSSTQL